MVAFETGEAVTFTVAGATVVAVSFRTSDGTFSVSERDCAKLHDVRFETVSLLWDGLEKRAVDSKYAYVQFDMGRDSARAYGELPYVQLFFEGGRYSHGVLVTPIAKGGWQDTDL